MIFELYSIPGKSVFAVGDIVFTDASIAELREFSQFWVGQRDIEIPGDNALRDLEFVRRLQDTELRDYFILQILLKELESLGRFDIVEAVKSIKGA